MDLFGGKVEGVVVPDGVNGSIDGWQLAVGSGQFIGRRQFG